ncbi:ABC transporter ATP-binding protein [Sporomusa sphaeroides]|uniref:Aliphatic sulfonates import ATP-binding protein SsuB n=1 Tax=Sporomusa sphaeroides DSM 2875 TaxID=1337886 RepID=A0ABM9W5R5_9FIRM|nr:ABC transporter ATP-binding protein [Sporomusa sphaeroides]OLS55149.1 aliphatic sulfonates import ATP-binding protein SsuB [Sporomusa sphaeroides DSM 2875]CVK20513.1 Aliphatic sulfonates import ATP-binding protein SsuB [Sporomusa sphaeroides DSM 2875]
MSLTSIEPQPLIINNLNKTFQIAGKPVDVLKDINLTVEPGEFISIIGPSGCGKSTLLRLVVGLERGFSGEIRLGEDWIEGPGLNRGMVFQEARLYPWLTVEENVLFGLGKEENKQDKQRIVQEHLELVGLAGFAKAYPHQLSGGMQQRVSIARALVNRPQVLLLDEPFGALDAMTRITMQQEIIRIWGAEKTTILLVTHDIDEAIFLGDRVVVMSKLPATAKSIIPVDLPRPRDRNSYEFVKIRKQIYTEFFSDVELPFAYSI